MNSLLIDLGPPTVTEALVLAQTPGPPPGRGEEFGKASPVGLVVIILLGLATVLLIRNMSKRIKRLPESFDEPTPRSKEKRAEKDERKP